MLRPALAIGTFVLASSREVGNQRCEDINGFSDCSPGRRASSVNYLCVNPKDDGLVGDHGPIVDGPDHPFCSVRCDPKYGCVDRNRKPDPSRTCTLCSVYGQASQPHCWCEVPAPLLVSESSQVEEVFGGACTRDEQSVLGDPQNVGKKANDCGTSSYNIFTGKFNHDKFNSCFSASIGISTTCAECYAATGEYGASNCKADCILGWCKSGCLSCTEPAQKVLASCTGFASGTAQPCEEMTV